MNASGDTILITGGRSGIGRELAHRFHGAGTAVVATGRLEDALAETAPRRPRIATALRDVDDADAIAAFARRVTADHPR